MKEAPIVTTQQKDGSLILGVECREGHAPMELSVKLEPRQHTSTMFAAVRERLRTAWLEHRGQEH